MRGNVPFDGLRGPAAGPDAIAVGAPVAGPRSVTRVDLPLDHLRALWSWLTVEDDRSSRLSERLCRLCVELTGVDGGAITLEYATLERVTMAATDDIAARLEDLQEIIREGPGWDAHRDFHVVEGHLLTTSRWPVFAAAAQHEFGHLWMCTAPVRAGGELIGVLMLYVATDDEDLRPVTDLAGVQFLADLVGAAYHTVEEVDVDEHPLWAPRARVHQAAGMMVSQLGLPVTDAFALLRAHAFTYGSTLQEVADSVVAGTLVFDAPPAAGGGSR